MIKFNKYYILIFLALSSCGLFSTRDPESPDTGKSTFVPPTSAIDVVTNFKNAIIEKNTENYSSCFFDSVNATETSYSFVPSADAYALYQSIFDNWNLDDEKHIFLAIISKLPDGISPQLEFTNSDYIDRQPNSETYISDYHILVNHNIQGLDTAFAGTLQFIIKRRESNGYWYIQKWTDNNPSNDSVGATWSILKAQFAK